MHSRAALGRAPAHPGVAPDHRARVRRSLHDRRARDDSSTFIVPVELADPSVEFVYATFIDYNPLTGDGLVEEPRHSVFEAYPRIPSAARAR